MGVTGREVTAGYARSSTWGVPASVTAGLLISGTEGWDGGPTIVDDDAFNQTFRGAGDAGDFAPPTPDLAMQLRYEEACPKFLAAAMGSASAPSSISSGANSITAFQHVLTLASHLSHFFTFAAAMGSPAQYIAEIPTAKIKGFTIKVGDNGRMLVTFPTVGNKPVYDSTVNTNSTVAGATVAALGNRVFRSSGTFRMNVQGAGSLVAADVQTVAKEITFGTTRPLAQDDHCFDGNGYIIEPEDDGFAEFPVEITFARMNTVSANSLATALKAAGTFKADMTFLGPFINSTSQRKMQFEWPALQLTGFKASVTGQNQVRPVGTFTGRLAASSPVGMAFVSPLQITVVNTNSANLLA
jgi:hypothetical protein